MKKGDTSRYILWFIVLLIIVILGLVIVYTGGLKILKIFFEKKIFGGSA